MSLFPYPGCLYTLSILGNSEVIMDKPASLLILLISLLLVLAQGAAAASECYCKNTGEVDQCGGSTYACGADTGSVQSCCVLGDICLDDGFCQFSHALQGTSGYYLSGCTDPTFQDPKCLGQCGKWRLVTPYRIGLQMYTLSLT